MIWLQHVLNELQLTKTAAIIYQNNNGAIEKVTEIDAKLSAKKKHEGTRFQNFADMVRRNEIMPKNVSTEEMESNLLTRKLAAKPFERAVRDGQLFW